MRDLIEIANRFVRYGYNVIPIGSDKAPTCIGEYGQFYDQHLPEEIYITGIANDRKLIDIECMRKKATGLGLLGTINPRYPEYRLVIIDVDDPKAWHEKVLSNLPGNVKQRLEETWKWRTGPRCPVDGDKHGITCQGEVCVHGVDNESHEFNLKDAPRGLAYAVLVPRECAAVSRTKFLKGAIELRIRNYEVIPPSLHPSGVQYEWVNPPFDPNDPNLFRSPTELTCEEWRTLIQVLGSAESAKGRAKAAVPIVLKELSDEELNRIKELLKPAYRPGNRQFLVLYLSGWFAKDRIHPISCVKLVKALHDETNDEDPLKQRLSAVVYSYKKAGINIDDFAQDIETLTGVKPYGLDKEMPQVEVKGRSGVKEILTQVLGEEETKKIIKEINRLIRGLVTRRIGCVKWTDEGTCLAEIIARLYEDKVVVIKRSLTKREGWVNTLIAKLPRDIKIIHDKFFNEDFYTANIGGEFVVSNDIDEFIAQLRKRHLFAVEKITNEIVDAIKKLMKRVYGYITPGITEEGIVDPYNQLDLTDYGIEGLIEAHRWIKNYYPRANAKKALANVAFLTAKIVSPVVKKYVKTFVDYVIWNYGRGRVPISEGKSSLVNYVLAPLLGIEEFDAGLYVIIKGAVSSEAQLRNLVSLNRLPLILDEQTGDKLKANASLILAASVGMGIIGVHAARHGLGIDTKFINYRGVMVFTNVTFNSFLRDVKELASDAAFTRRVLVINWENQPIKPSAFDNLPKIKPILGAVNNVFRKHKDDLINAKDLIDLAEKLFIDLAKEYAKNDEKRKIIMDYINAIKTVTKEAQKEGGRIVLNDEDILVNAAYEFARKMGVQVKSVRDVIDAVLDNPSASGIELARPKRDEFSQEELVEIKERVVNLFGATLDNYLNHPNVPSSVARALQEDKVIVRVYAGALDGKIPNARQFMGKPRIHYREKNAYYYRLMLNEFLKPFLARLGLEEDEDG